MTTPDRIVSRHYMVQPAGTAGQAPEWIHLLPAGTFKGADGRGPYHVSDPATLISNSMAAAGKLVLDENHSTDTAATAGQPAPARGWIVELQARDDGIWGRVEWTDGGKQLMGAQEYRGISPVFVNDKAGDVKKLLRAALTNNPNLELHPLHSKETYVDFAAQLRKALGLTDGADDAAILAAVTAQGTAIAAHAQSIAAIAAAAGLTATDPDALVTQLQAVRAGASNVATMAAQIVGLETQINTMKAAGAQAAAAAFVDAAITAGKPIVASRDYFVERHIADPAGTEKVVNGMPSIHAGGMPAGSRHDDGGGDGDALSTEEMSVCKKMGLDPKKFAEQRNKMRKGK